MKKFTKRIAAAALTSVLLIIYAVNAGAADYIKWIDFTLKADIMNAAMKCDISTYGTERHVNWIELLSYLAAKHGGNFSGCKTAEVTEAAGKYAEGTDFSELSSNIKLYNYYCEAYSAVLGGLVGKYTEFTSENGETTTCEGYGLVAFSPIAKGYYYSHFDDFGAARSFGYKRHHLGHDLVGSVGSPVVAVEGGYVEACGWNMYGGWRIGIRSFDGKRYYYYAHLRKNHPYNDMYEGKTVYAGEVIGYLGMTGYSRKPNTNNINTPHLHYGLEIIFDKAQKDGYCQIWVDMYELTKFLSQNCAPCHDNGEGEKMSGRYRVPDTYPD